MRRRVFVAGAVVVVALSACSGKGRDAAPTTTAPPPTTAATTRASPPTTTVPNPDVVPAVITPAYVNAVFAVLNHLNGNVSRALVADGRITPQAMTDLRAIYNDPLYEQELTFARNSLSQSSGNVRKPPGDVMTTVRRLIFGSRTCMFVETTKRLLISAHSSGAVRSI